VTTLQQRLRDEMVRRNYSPTTIRSYLHALRTCERYHRGRRLQQLGRDALRRYQCTPQEFLADTIRPVWAWG
jgi:site-specific recombinase XerD